MQINILSIRELPGLHETQQKPSSSSGEVWLQAKQSPLGKSVAKNLLDFNGAWFCALHKKGHSSHAWTSQIHLVNRMWIFWAQRGAVTFLFLLTVYIYVHLKAQEGKQKLRYSYSIICSGQGFHIRSMELGIQLLYSQVLYL